jgi:alpha,alpha-trehalose phosphorylase
VPEAARDALRWRHSTLHMAQARARELHLRGAAFPWRTIDGRECSGYWPAGTAAFHIGADIADAVVRYIAATGDEEFEDQCGIELLCEIARLFASLGHRDAAGNFRIDGVTGPDEYTAIVDNNLFTNLMARHALREAAAAARRKPEVTGALGVGEAEVADWEDAAGRMLVPFDERLGIHRSPRGSSSTRSGTSTARRPSSTPPPAPPYFELYRKQLVKQADLVLAMHLRGDAFTAEQKARNFAYYEAITVRDSSLSASTQAILAAEVGHLELAYDYLGEAAFVDLKDLKENVEDGVHIASLAGTWSVIVSGFGGARDHGGKLTFAPRLPPALEGITFRFVFRGSRLLVAIRAERRPTRSSTATRSRPPTTESRSRSARTTRSPCRSRPSAGPRADPPAARADADAARPAPRSRNLEPVRRRPEGQRGDAAQTGPPAGVRDLARRDERGAPGRTASAATARA